MSCWSAVPTVHNPCRRVEMYLKTLANARVSQANIKEWSDLHILGDSAHTSCKDVFAGPLQHNASPKPRPCRKLLVPYSLRVSIILNLTGALLPSAILQKRVSGIGLGPVHGGLSVMTHKSRAASHQPDLRDEYSPLVAECSGVMARLVWARNQPMVSRYIIACLDRMSC